MNLHSRNIIEKAKQRERCTRKRNPLTSPYLPVNGSVDGSVRFRFGLKSNGSSSSFLNRLSLEMKSSPASSSSSPSSVLQSRKGFWYVTQCSRGIRWGSCTWLLLPVGYCSNDWVIEPQHSAPLDRRYRKARRYSSRKCISRTPSMYTIEHLGLYLLDEVKQDQLHCICTRRR